MNLLVITYWSYKDALIQTYTLPYLKIIQKYRPKNAYLYLLTLEQPHLLMTSEEREEIEEYLSEFRIKLISFVYKPFGLSAILLWIKIIFKMIFLIFRNRVEKIHCFCTDAAAAGYILSKLTAKPLIVDSYEPHAEPMLESGTWERSSIAFRILFAFEKWQSRHAEIVIACVDKMKEYALEKYNAKFKRFYSKPACVDFTLFSEEKIKDESLLRALNLTDKKVLIYAGKFGGSYMREEVFDIIKVAQDYFGEAFRVLLLGKHLDDDLKRDCAKRGIDYKIILHKFVPHSEVAIYMGLADFAITPFIPVPSKRYGSPIKNGEYWAMGLPVIIPPNISDDSDIIKKYNLGVILEKLEKACYKETINKIDLILKEGSDARRQRIRKVAKKYRSFKIADEVYKDIYAV